MEFGAVLERVPSAGGQWATTAAAPARGSAFSALLPLLLTAVVATGLWFGYQYWFQEQLPLPEAAATYVDGTGVDYVSPITGIGGNFAGAPTEVQLGIGVPAVIFAGDDFTMIVAAFPAGSTEETVAAASAPYETDNVKTGMATVGPTVYAVAVGGSDARAVDAVYERFTGSLRLPGGASI